MRNKLEIGVGWGGVGWRIQSSVLHIKLGQDQNERIQYDTCFFKLSLTSDTWASCQNADSDSIVETNTALNEERNLSNNKKKTVMLNKDTNQ